MDEKSFFKVVDSKNMCLAIVLRHDYSPSETTFYSEQEYSQQIGIIKYPKAGKIKPHFHNELSRNVVFTQEVLVVRKGAVRVDLYDKDLLFIQSVTLHQHDVIFLVSGGHGFEMMEDCELLEVKQGPYSGVNNDKTHFESHRQ